MTYLYIVSRKKLWFSLEKVKKVLSRDDVKRNCTLETLCRRNGLQRSSLLASR